MQTVGARARADRKALGISGIPNKLTLNGFSCGRSCVCARREKGRREGAVVAALSRKIRERAWVPRYPMDERGAM